MSFVDRIEQHAQRLEDEESWFELKSRAFGRDSVCPLKILVSHCGQKWQRAWNNGLQSYRRQLSKGKKRQFDDVSKNPLALPPDTLAVANLRAVEESGALVKVALVGPVLDRPSARLTTEQRKNYEIAGERLPEHIQDLYERSEDGLYRIPIQTEPPPEWVVPEDEVGRLLKWSTFVNEVGEAHVRLVDEGSEGMEDEMGNSSAGSGGAEPGETSPSPSEQG